MALKKATILKGAGGLFGLGSAIVGAIYLSKSPEVPQKQIDAPAPVAPEEEKIPEKGPAEIAQPKNIRSSLTSKGFNPLNTDKNNEKDKESWTKLVQKFIEEKDKPGQKLAALVATTNSWATDLNANIANMKEACNNLLEKKPEEGADLASDEKTATDWCTQNSEFLKVAESKR